MIKLNEKFKQAYDTITDNLKRELAEWVCYEKDTNVVENVVASILTGNPIFDVEQDGVDYSNKYKKATIKESLQNYVLTQLNNGVNDVPLFFIFELKEFGKFDYSDFVDSLDKDVLKIIPTNLKKFFEEYLEFDQTSYTLNTIVEAINDPMEYGELIKVTATISIKMV